MKEKIGAAVSSFERPHGASVMTIRKKILTALISVLSVFIIFTSIILIRRLGENSLRNAITKLYDSSKGLCGFTESVIKNVYDTNKALAKSFESFYEIPAEKRRDYFNNLQKEILKDSE